jgi:hypothetical protein
MDFIAAASPYSRMTKPKRLTTLLSSFVCSPPCFGVLSNLAGVLSSKTWHGYCFYYCENKAKMQKTFQFETFLHFPLQILTFDESPNMDENESFSLKVRSTN